MVALYRENVKLGIISPSRKSHYSYQLLAFVTQANVHPRVGMKIKAITKKSNSILKV